MPAWKFTGDAERIFPDQGLSFAPGDVVEAADCPDPTFFVAADGASPNAEDPAWPAVDPSTDEPDPES